MNVLILGSGGREHALSWKISQSRLLEKLYIAPGNAGTRMQGTNVALQVNDFEAIGNFCLEKKIDLVVVGPEEPLVKGIKDYFAGKGSGKAKAMSSPCEKVAESRVVSEPVTDKPDNGNLTVNELYTTGKGENKELPEDKNSPAGNEKPVKDLKGITVIGPDSVGALLEGSKAFAKQFMKKYGIPTARYLPVTRTTLGEGLGFMETLKPPYVLKADGLAAGKGVLIIDDRSEAEKELKSMLDGKFGNASCKVVIEEFLSGIELSVFVLTDGKNYVMLPEAKDYKRIGEGDTGPNTGGMGSVSPVPFAGKEFMKKVESRIIKPTIKGLQSEKIDYRGFIFFGLINVGGNPFVIEYNVRLGDPETEAIIPRIRTDLLELMKATEKQELNKYNIDIDPRVVASVMLVSGGYPGSYKKGLEISGLDKAAGNGLSSANNSGTNQRSLYNENDTAGNMSVKSTETIVFHAGTKSGKGRVVTNGGRVLAVSSLAITMEEALNICYKTAGQISFDNVYYRKDIGKDLG